MKQTYLLILIFVGCNSVESPEKLWEQVQEFRTQKDLQNAITSCNLILDNYPENDIASLALFQKGDIYLNDVHDYDFAIKYFKEVAEIYPTSKESEKASFMIGYILANNLDSYSDAEEYYNKFLNLYPESDLIHSVNYELEVLVPLLKTIDSLNKN